MGEYFYRVLNTKVGRFFSVAAFIDLLTNFVLFPVVDDDGPMFESTVNYSETVSFAFMIIERLVGENAESLPDFTFHLFYSFFGVAGFILIFFIVSNPQSFIHWQSRYKKENVNKKEK